MLNRRYWFWIQALVFLAPFLFAGCSSSKRSSNDPIRIGEVEILTGNDATFGESTHKGVKLAIQQANEAGGIRGQKLELITLDDQGKPSEAVLAITKLAQQHQVRAVIGEVASTLSIAMGPIAQQYKVPLVSPSSINSKVTKQGEFVFRVCFLDVFQSKVMADFAFENLKARKVAILQDVKSDYSRDSSTYFTDAFTQKGGKVVLVQSYSGGDIDFQSQLTAIRAVAPDLILVPGYYTEIGLIARQAKGLGIKAPLLGGDGWDSPKLAEIGGSAIEGSYFVTHFSKDDPADHVQTFVKSYREKYNEAPNGLAALGYDAARLLVDAFKRAEGNDSEALRKAIAETRDFAGVTGSITMDPGRNAVKSAVIFQVASAGQLKLIRKFLP